MSRRSVVSADSSSLKQGEEKAPDRVIVLNGFPKAGASTRMEWNAHSNPSSSGTVGDLLATLPLHDQNSVLLLPPVPTSSLLVSEAANVIRDEDGIPYLDSFRLRDLPNEVWFAWCPTVSISVLISPNGKKRARSLQLKCPVGVSYDALCAHVCTKTGALDARYAFVTQENAAKIGTEVVMEDQKLQLVPVRRKEFRLPSTHQYISEWVPTTWTVADVIAHLQSTHFLVQEDESKKEEEEQQDLEKGEEEEEEEENKEDEQKKELLVCAVPNDEKRTAPLVTKKRLPRKRRQQQQEESTRSSAKQAVKHTNNAS